MNSTSLGVSSKREVIGMGSNNSNKGASATEEPLALRTLSWMFLKTVVFCAFVCVVVLSMAELVTH